MWRAEEGAPHPDSRSIGGSQAGTDSAGPEPREPCTDELPPPNNPPMQSATLRVGKVGGAKSYNLPTNTANF